MNGRKKILIISEAHLIRNFVLTTIKRIKQETGTSFDCFITTTIDDSTRHWLSGDFENVFVNEYPKGLIRKIPKFRLLQNIYGLRKLARKLPEYDIVHIHYYYFYYAFLTPIIRKKTKRLLLTFFGSDYYRVNNFTHLINKRSLFALDGIFAENETMLEDIAKRYRLNKRRIATGILMFMMDNYVSFADFLNNHTNCSAKKIWHFEKGVIVCGYSAGALMQHSKIIDGLKKVEDKLKNFITVFPMTYGWNAKNTRAMVKEKLHSCQFDSQILEDFLPINSLHALRLAADIFIVIPSTDQMAASLLEHLVAGSVIITGSWLPYRSLIELGVYCIMIDSADSLATVLAEVLDHLDEHKRRSSRNKDIILKMIQWESIRKNWYNYYELNGKLCR
jgi:glycosyltransferase involved in cell wall biosynthesis